MSDVEYTVDQIIDFCKAYNIMIIDRKDKKNQEFRYKYGISTEDQIDFIKNYLAARHCTKDNFPDYDTMNNLLYEFHVLFANKWCYIKLCVVEDQKLIKVISFHEDEGVNYGKNL